MTTASASPKRSSICLIIPYFGKLPPYLACFLRSCECNPDIDWLVLTDDQKPDRLPPNVHYQQTRLAGLRSRFSAKMGLDVEIPTPSVLCNFRPAYGFLFEEELKGYDFWGHCDFDMVFGNLRKFLTEEILGSHEKVLCRGHLTLYRNIEKVNRYFMLDCPGVPNYREKYTTRGVPQLQWDEWQGINLILRYHGIKQFHDEFIVDVEPPSRWKITRFKSTAGPNYLKQVFYWHEGRVFHAHYNCDLGLADDEYAYIHFQKRPMPAPGFDPFSAPGFLITPEGFYPYNREPLRDADFERYNRERWRSKKEIFARIRRAIGKRLGLVKPQP